MSAGMSDAELKDKWSKITDPVEAIKEFLNYSEFVGSDPYYRDLDAALWAMLARAVEEQP